MLEAPYRRGAAPLRDSWQRVVHALVVVAGWVLFGWGWLRVLAEPGSLLSLWLLLAGSATLLPAITLAWIAHNLAIHRRKGPRTHVPKVDARYASDWNGRTVDADWSALAAARRIVIGVEGTRKLYRAEALEAVDARETSEAIDAADAPDARETAEAHEAGLTPSDSAELA